MTNLTLKVKVSSFKLVQNLRIINEQFVKAKLQNGQFKSLKLIFSKFKGQFELEDQDQGQGHQFFLHN